MATMLNEDHKKRVRKVGIPDCDQIRCPKLYDVLKAVLPKDAIKADGTCHVYNSSGWTLWPTLAALLESTEAGDLMPQKAVSATQTALHLMGNAHQQMAQEWRKKLILKLNPSLRFMTEDNKSFVFSAPMLLGQEFAKLATTTVDQMKTMKKLSFSPEKKSFSGYHPVVIKAVAGVEPREVVQDTSPFRGEDTRQAIHPTAQHKAVKNKGTTFVTKYCRLFKRNYNLSPYVL